MADPDPQPNPFARLDQAAPDLAEHAIGILREMARDPGIQLVRATALELLAARPGQRLLDAGAGSGEVARQLAGLVSPGGSVVALDLSETAVSAGPRPARRQPGPVPAGRRHRPGLPGRQLRRGAL
jgi:2-polyprenyl-3-methyl-5-hydroxy-6-metoxy-1,4-benzoquinol methylase